MTASEYIGRVLGEFCLEEQIGGGGGGDVFRARQRVLQRDAVVKIHSGERGESSVQRFLQEARLASRLDHPFAAHVYAFGVESDGVMWIAMELVRGTPLSLLLERGPLEGGITFLQRVCEVVQATHDVGMIHGDLKPSNIMVVSRVGSLFPKLLDFGIARELRDNISGGIGTPQYMAPEQWVPGRALTPATDVYALGALAYEVLTGNPPFVGTSRIELARHHARSKPPLLPEGFPARMNEAIAKAMAKAPADRFVSANELARAFGPDDQASATVNLPRLDELTRDDALLGAPEPIAEAVVRLDAATDPVRAYGDALRVAGSIAQYAGVIAIACRLRVGGVDNAIAAALLSRLRSAGLGPRDWWRLTRELVRSFAGIRDVYPVPELVGTFFDGTADTTTALDAVLGESDALTNPPAEVASIELARMIPPLGVALRSLRWLRDYRLVVPTQHGAQQWMGVRRRDRPRVELERPPEQAVLIGAENTIVVNLGDVVRVHAAVPGAPRQLFLLDGAGRRGAARFRAVPSDLEHEVSDGWERAGIGAVSVGEQVGDAGSPYLGLASFTERHTTMFFGRERELEEMLNRLDSQRFLAVVAPSGAGKSSFVRAGVVPALGEQWRTLTMRPAGAPMQALAQHVSALTGATLTAEHLRSAPDALSRSLARSVDAGNIFIFVDQFEELFTMSSDAAEQNRFAEALVVCASEHERLRVVVTVRDDFLVRAAQLAALRTISSSLLILTTPAPADLRRIIVEPARRSGFDFEDAQLVDEMVAEVASQAGALALLSFTASKLWDLRDRQAKQLTRRAYRALGGVGGALAQHAETVLGSMDEPRRNVVRELFRHLVTAEGTRAVLSRNEVLEVSGGELAIPVVETLISERLLTAMEIPGGESIEVVHETLLVQWPRLVEWRAQDAENARLRDQLRATARQWEERGQPRGMLWRGDAFVEYQLWRKRYPGSLTALEEAFGAASNAEARRGRRVRRGILGATIIALTSALVIFIGLRARAQHALLQSYLDQAASALDSGDPLAALVFLDGAAALGGDSLPQRFMIARAMESVSPAVATMDLHAPGLQIAFEPDGSIVTAGSDGVLRGWDGSGGVRWAAPPYPPGDDPVFAVDRSGQWIASAAEHTIELRTPDGRVARRLEGHTANVFSLHFMHDGARLVSSGFDGTARVWDLVSGQVHVLDTHLGTLTVSSVSGDHVIAAGSTASGTKATFTTWSVGETAALEPVVVGDGLVFAAAISPDGKYAAIGMTNGEIQFWDLDSRRPLHTLTGHEGPIMMIVPGPGGTFITASADSTLKVWDPARGVSVRTLRGHHGAITGCALGKDGHLVSASVDGTARIWDVNTGLNLRTFAHAGSLLLAVSDDGQRIATSSSLGTAKLWRADAPVGVEPLADDAIDSDHPDPWVTHDGTRLIRGSSRGGELWDLIGRRLLARLGGASTLVAGDEDSVYFADDQSISVLRALNGALLKTYAAPFRVAALCVEPGGGHIVVGGGSPPMIAVLDASGREVARTATEPNAGVICDRGSVLVTGTGASAFALPSLAPQSSVTGTNYTFAHRLSTLGVVGLSAYSAEVWQHGTRTHTQRFGRAPIVASASDSVLAVGLDDGTLSELALPTFAPALELRAHTAAVESVAVSGELVATLAYDGTVKVWPVNGVRAISEMRVPPDSYWVQFAGDLLVVDDSRNIDLWRVDLSAMNPDELSRVVACNVPAQVRAQIGGPDRSLTCPGNRPP